MIATLTVLAVFFTVAGAVTIALANIWAAKYGKPVQEAQDRRINDMKVEISQLRDQNGDQAKSLAANHEKIENLKELVTNAARVENLFAASSGWRVDSQREHEAMMVTMREMAATLQQIAKNVAMSTRVVVDTANRAGIPVRKDDEGTEASGV